MVVTAPGRGEERCCLGRMPFRAQVLFIRGTNSESGRVDRCVVVVWLEGSV